MAPYLSLPQLVANIDSIPEIKCSALFSNKILILGKRNNNSERVCHFVQHIQTNLCQLWTIDVILQIHLNFLYQKHIAPLLFPIFFHNIVILDVSKTYWLVSSVLYLALVLAYVSLCVSYLHIYLIVVLFYLNVLHIMCLHLSYILYTLLSACVFNIIFFF